MAFGLHFPDESHFDNGYRPIQKQKNKSEYVSTGSPRKTEVEILKQNGKTFRVSYFQSENFTDHQISEFSRLHGRGGEWSESPLSFSVKKMLNADFPGIEQQWFLNGYDGETGWMGAGLFQERFFIVFQETIPPQELEVKDPLKIRGDLESQLKNSGSWVKRECAPRQTGTFCFASILGSRITLEIDKSYRKIGAWMVENNPIKEIENTLKALTRDQYQEFSRNLADLSKLEGQSSFLAFVSEAPEIFNWGTYQIQQQKPGLLSIEDYEKNFSDKKNKWPYITVFQFQNDFCKIRIDLHFNGHYHLTAESLRP